MKKFAIWSIIFALTLSLAACAGSSGGDTVRVKCPSCGYQFDADLQGDGVGN